MFSRTKLSREQNADQTNAVSDILKAPDARATPENPSQSVSYHLPKRDEPGQSSVTTQPVAQSPTMVTAQSADRARKRLVIAEGITIKGEISGCEHLAIEGEAYAEIDVCGKLEILENGTFKGSASVSDAEISGYCDGTLVVSNTLRVRRTGYVVGSVQYGSLQVEEGGRVVGEMKTPRKDNNNSEIESEARPANSRWLVLNEKLSSISSS